MRWAVGRGEISTSEPVEYHTADNPYCPDFSCYCRTDLNYHGQVTGATTANEYYNGKISTQLDYEVDEEDYEWAIVLLGTK